MKTPSQATPAQKSKPQLPRSDSLRVGRRYSEAREDEKNSWFQPESFFSKALESGAVLIESLGSASSKSPKDISDWLPSFDSTFPSLVPPTIPDSGPVLPLMGALGKIAAVDDLGTVSFPGIPLLFGQVEEPPNKLTLRSREITKGILMEIEQLLTIGGSVPKQFSFFKKHTFSGPSSGFAAGVGALAAASGISPHALTSSSPSSAASPASATTARPNLSRRTSAPTVGFMPSKQPVGIGGEVGLTASKTVDSMPFPSTPSSVVIGLSESERSATPSSKESMSAQMDKT